LPAGGVGVGETQTRPSASPRGAGPGRGLRALELAGKPYQCGGTQLGPGRADLRGGIPESSISGLVIRGPFAAATRRAWCGAGSGRRDDQFDLGVPGPGVETNGTVCGRSRGGGRLIDGVRPSSLFAGPASAARGGPSGGAARDPRPGRQARPRKRGMDLAPGPARPGSAPAGGGPAPQGPSLTFLGDEVVQVTLPLSKGGSRRSSTHEPFPRPGGEAEA